MKPRVSWIVLVLALFAILVAHGDRVIAHDNDDVEELDVVEEVEPTETSESSPFMDFLGEQHPALIHFPIAWLTLLLLLELVNLRLRNPGLHTTGRYLLMLAVVSFVPALTTGLIKADLESFKAPYDSILNWHRNLNILTFALTLLALFIRPRELEERSSGRDVVYRLLILVTAALVLVSGHLGGRLVHG